MKKILFAVVIIFLLVSCSKGKSSEPKSQDKETTEKTSQEVAGDPTQLLEEILSEKNLGYTQCYTQKVYNHRSSVELKVLLYSWSRKVITTFTYHRFKDTVYISGIQTFDDDGDRRDWKQNNINLNDYVELLKKDIEDYRERYSDEYALKYLIP